MASRNFPFYKQLDSVDCGAACLRMIAKYHGRPYSLDYLRDLTWMGREGVSLRGISDGAEYIGFHTLAAKLSFERLVKDIPLPAIAHWKQNHFLVVYKISRRHVWVADPAIGKLKLSKSDFLKGWISDNQGEEDTVCCLLWNLHRNFMTKRALRAKKTHWPIFFVFPALSQSYFSTAAWFVCRQYYSACHPVFDTSHCRHGDQ